MYLVSELISPQLSFGTQTIKMAAANEDTARSGNDLAARPAAGGSIPTDSSRPNNLQRIAIKKQQVRSFPRAKKLEKLAVYSSCKVCEPGFVFLGWDKISRGFVYFKDISIESHCCAGLACEFHTSAMPYVII